MFRPNARFMAVEIWVIVNFNTIVTKQAEVR